ncbi:HAMP domain-containing sensor histidine kinase [Kitasatospora sp. GP82]|uniref:HAMP domain-containing sensor histidine kinase n=1 Tax=Kitasatospora sp. GP82 TaxID=3035089 RepID=UPI002474FCDC|nr:HAMP domain-containing sensor histidine kinase [Kitasatospora sp. GP82]MDH6130562.1 two-component system sensor histidine kinase MtrB [Kitasatospora sp. GP82]
MTGRLGLRGRIAVTVLFALLLPSVLLSVLSYRALRNRAEQDFRARTLASALSDFTSAANSIRSQVKPNALLSANEALAVRKFNTYVVYAMKPNPDGTGYTAPDPNEPVDPDQDPNTWPGLKATSAGANDAHVPLTSLADFMNTGDCPPLIDERHLNLVHPAGRTWLLVGAIVGKQGPDDRYPGAPVLAVENYSLQPVDDETGVYLRSLLLVSSATVVVGALLAWLVAGRVQRPVRAAGAAARALGAGDLTVRLPVSGRDELSDLSSSFNQMADHLADTIDQLTRHEARQRQFVADVSHELRTPTASLLAAATALEYPTTRDSAASLIAPQLRRLATLTEDLLEISRMDAGEATVAPQPVDLADLVADVVAHSESPESVTVRTEGDTSADVDPRRMHTVITNLVSNALRHGAAPVEVTVRAAEHSVVVRVADSGPGVPEELHERVFDRFVRADPARAFGHGGPGGNGLGLAIARENARLHRATLTLTNEPGAVFTLTVPKR